MKLTFLDVVDRDIRKIHAELETAQPGLGNRFTHQLRAVFERIEANPNMYGLVWRDVRAVRLRRFRYVVYYVAYDDRVEVLAVLHGSQSPATWKSRT